MRNEANACCARESSEYVHRAAGRMGCYEECERSAILTTTRCLSDSLPSCGADGSYDFSVCHACAVLDFAYDLEVEKGIRGLIPEGSIGTSDLALRATQKLVRMALDHSSVSRLMASPV